MSETTESLQAAFDGNDLPRFALDRELRYTSFNPAHAAAMRELYGVEIVAGASILARQTVEADRETLRAHLTRALTGERVVAGDYFGDPGRERRYYDVVHAPLRDADGEIVGVEVRAHDVSDRQRTEEELRASEARFRSYFEQTLVAVMVASPDRRLVEVNDAACELLGYGRDELLLLTWLDLTHPADLAADRARNEGLLDGKTHSTRFLKRFVRKDGEVVHVDMSLSCLRRPDGSVDSFVALISDVTEQRRAAQESALLKHSIDVQRDGAYWMDAEDRFVYVNEAGCFALGYAREELIGRHLSLVNPEATPEVLVRVWERLRSAGSLTAETVHRRKDGSELPVEIASSHVTFAGREYNCGFAHDITERRRAEEALRDSERFLQAVLDDLSATIAVLDGEGTIVHVNKTWREFAEHNGADPESVSEGANYLEVCDQASGDEAAEAAAFARGIRSVLSGEAGAYALEYSCHAPDQKRWFAGLVTSLAYGGERGVIVAHENITERVEAVAAVRESEERYRLLAENSSDVVFQSTDTALTWVSPSVTALSGWLPEQLVGQPLEALVHPDDLPGLTLAWGRAQTADSFRAETRLRYASGDYRWLSITLHTVVDGSGQPILIGSARDIQEQVEAREALAKSERRYRALSESSPDFIFVFDRELRVRYLNPASTKVFRRAPEELVGTFIEDLFDAETARGMSAGLRVVFESGEPRHTESEWPGPWGRRWLATWIVPIRDASGAVTEVFGVSRDIADLKRAQSELAALNAELEQRVETRTAELRALNEELEAFAYAVSHDLRAPLRAIDGFSHIILDDEADALSEAGRENLARVRAAAQRMGQLIDALLALSRLSRQALNIGRVDLSALAHRTLAGLSEQEPARQVRMHVSDGCTAVSDVDLVEVVLTNLLDNAWKFTSNRELGSIEFGEKQTDGQRAFYVRDNGVGFDPAYAGKLFQPFQRLHHTGDFPGTGIGLATVRRIITRLGGRVWAEAEVGKGATFSFTLPEPADDA